MEVIESQRSHDFKRSPEFWVLVMFFAFAFDHKGEEGGNVFVYSMVVIFFLSSFVCLTIYRIKPLSTVVEKMFLWLIVGPILFCAFPLLFGELSLDSFVRACLPYAIMALAYRVIVSLNSQEVFNILPGVFWAGTFSVLFTIIFGFAFSQSSIHEIRYQIISAYTAAVLALCAADLYYGFSLRASRVASLIVIILVAAVSVTRGHFISVFGSLFLCVFLCNDSRSKTVRNFAWPAYFVFVIGVGIVLWMFFPEVFDRWYERIVYLNDSIGFDPSSLTRLAEIEAQIDALTSDLFSLIFGRGIGGSYVWSDNYNILLRGYVGDVELMGEYTYVGHNLWIYSLFASGVIVGMFVPFALLYAFWKSISLFLKIRKAPVNGLSNIFCYLSMACIVFSSFFLLTTIAGNLLGTRIGGLLFGSFAGVLAILDRELKRIVVFQD